MPQAKILYVNEPKWVEKMRKMRASIKIKIDGNEEAYINGDEHDFEDMEPGQTVTVHKDGKGYWQLGEGSTKSGPSPTQPPAQPAKPERTQEELRKHGSEMVNLFMSLLIEVKQELAMNSMSSQPDNVVLSTTVHIFNATVTT